MIADRRHDASRRRIVMSPAPQAHRSTELNRDAPPEALMELGWSLVSEDPPVNGPERPDCGPVDLGPRNAGTRKPALLSSTPSAKGPRPD